MKKFLFVLSLCAATMFAGCNKDDYRWYDGFADGREFVSGNFVRFYYLDENGIDLMNPYVLGSLPIASRTLLDEPPAAPESVDYDGAYLDRMNYIDYNSYYGIYEYFTWVYGDSHYSDYTFYVYFGGVPVRMDVSHKYQNKRTSDGDYYSTIVSWSANGVKIWPDSKNPYRKYVLIRRNADGTLSVEEFSASKLPTPQPDAQ